MKRIYTFLDVVGYYKDDPEALHNLKTFEQERPRVLRNEGRSIKDMVGAIYSACGANSLYWYEKYCQL